MPIEGRALENSTSVAYETNRVVKAAPGTLYKVRGYNSLASAQFIQIHNTISLPADAQVPVVVVTVAASSNFEIDYADIGRYFSVGITICNSTTGPTKTIGAANCWFDVQYTQMADYTQEIVKRWSESGADTDGGGVTVTHAAVTSQAHTVTSIQCSGDAAALITIESPASTVIWRKRYSSSFVMSEVFPPGTVVGVVSQAVLVKISAATTNAEANAQGFSVLASN